MQEYIHSSFVAYVIDAISVALPTISFPSILYIFSSAGTKE
ncbi:MULTISPECIES: hypothetical protein [unclassified Bacillus (in: firmicutes)]|nr:MULTISPECIES: hypothetical protein [unclassified Bacillus (in: firmicutes)]